MFLYGFFFFFFCAQTFYTTLYTVPILKYLVLCTFLPHSAEHRNHLFLMSFFLTYLTATTTWTLVVKEAALDPKGFRFQCTNCLVTTEVHLLLFDDRLKFVIGQKVCFSLSAPQLMPYVIRFPYMPQEGAHCMYLQSVNHSVKTITLS